MAMEEDEGRGYCYAGRESTLKHMLCGGNFLTRPPTADTFHPHYPPPDCPSLRASSKLPMFLPSSLVLSLQGVVWIYPPSRASTEHILIVRGLRAQGPARAAPLRFHHFQSRIEFMSAGCATDAIRFNRKFV